MRSFKQFSRPRQRADPFANTTVSRAPELRFDEEERVGERKENRRTHEETELFVRKGRQLFQVGHRGQIQGRNVAGHDRTIRRMDQEKYRRKRLRESPR